MGVPGGLSEAEVGISEFLRPAVPGFEGRFKERWQDFQVHEVDLAGVELRLSELVTPGAVAAELKQASAERREARAALGPAFAPEPEADRELRGALGESCAGRLCDFLRRQRPGSPRAPPDGGAAPLPEGVDDGGAGAGEGGGEKKTEEPPPFVDFDAASIGDGSKDARKRAHQTVLKLFGSFLNTETVEGEGESRTIRVWMRDAERRAKTACSGAGGEPGGKSSKAGKDVKDGGKGKGKGKGKKGKGKKGKDRKGRDESAAGDDGAAAGGEFGTLRREGWPKDRPDYLYFRLYKENCDTSEAVAGIARCVGRSAKQFTFAGTKDRRAATVQQICAHRLPADQLRRSVLHRLRDKRVRVSDMEYRAERLRLGCLRGNRFDVALRGVRAPAASDDVEAASVVARAFEEVACGGFLNYFGLQRFGTREVRTHQVGTALIAGRWQESVRLIVGVPAKSGDDVGGRQKRSAEDAGGQDEASQRPAKAARTDDAAAHAAADPLAAAEAEGPAGPPGGGAARREAPRWQAVQEARHIFEESGDAQRALEAMPRSQHLERCVLGALARSLPPIEALRQLPHQALSLYAHAAQSVVWNAVLSRRVRELGARPVVGDLVLSGEQPMELDDDPAASAEDAVGPDAPGDDAADDEGTAPVKRLPAVRVLASEEDLVGLQLSDVVLPLPGSDVEYPPCLRSAYEEVSRSLLGLPLDAFRASELVALTGSYRHASVKPGGLTWQFVPAAKAQSQPHGVLLTTDVAKLLSERPAWEATGTVASNAAASGAEADDVLDGGAASETAQGAGDDATVAATCGEGSASPPAAAVGAAVGAPSSSLPAAGRGPGAEAVAVESRTHDGAGGLPAVTFSCTLPPSAYLTMLLREVTKRSTER